MTWVNINIIILYFIFNFYRHIFKKFLIFFILLSYCSFLCNKFSISKVGLIKLPFWSLLFAYPFEGYWKDVGTIDSLWQANMDLLDPNHPLDISDTSFKIYARNYALPPSLISNSAEIINSMVAEGCRIKGKVKNSVIFTGCTIEEGASVYDSVIMPGTVIKSGATVSYTITGTNSVIGYDSKIGGNPEHYNKGDWGIAVIGKDVVIESNQLVKPKEII